MLSFCNFPQTYPTSTISVTVTVADLQLLPQDVIFINSQGYSFSIADKQNKRHVLLNQRPGCHGYRIILYEDSQLISIVIVASLSLSKCQVVITGIDACLGEHHNERSTRCYSPLSVMQVVTLHKACVGHTPVFPPR